VHADIQALKAILSITADKRFVRKYSRVERILNLGDTMERGSHPQEVVNTFEVLQQTLPVVSLLGNHDEALLFERPVSGSDSESREAHANSAVYESFLRPLPHCCLDVDNRIIAVHGGPIDPRELGDGWLFQRSWQRISTTSHLDASGYHYTPEEAFSYVKRAYGNGYVILCGHDHAEAAFSDRAGDLLETMRSQRSRFAGREVLSRWIARDLSTSYLIRVGIAGPEGYRNSVGLHQSHFGLIWRRGEEERIGLFRFPST
jgi:hypothetical protein